jgi:hypothetical protein
MEALFSPEQKLGMRSAMKLLLSAMPITIRPNRAHGVPTAFPIFVEDGKFKLFNLFYTINLYMKTTTSTEDNLYSNFSQFKTNLMIKIKKDAQK